MRVLLVDDHAIVREGFRVLLEEKSGLDVVVEEANGRGEALVLATDSRPDLVIMDVSLGDGECGIDVTREFAERFPGIAIIALSMHRGRFRVERMFEAGAMAYVLKETAFDEMLQAIESVQRGERYTSPRIEECEPGGVPVKGDEHGPPPICALSRRELDVLRLLSRGCSTKEMCDQLGLAKGTVETHRTRLRQRLGLHSTAELVRYAVAQGLC